MKEKFRLFSGDVWNNEPHISNIESLLVQRYGSVNKAPQVSCVYSSSLTLQPKAASPTLQPRAPSYLGVGAPVWLLITFLRIFSCSRSGSFN
ncbi:hypothetical protein E2C01_068557 [Portunus trituberculatus]|uniref:Uncharacterized protein n=1 Tax=Portunus trituberculatus TaxID=210409 RepID=A0A5B7HWF7_PORTR|nr:hypothetical protein [Portunus trituberculatus]